MTVILKGWMGPPGLGRNVPPIPGASGGAVPPPLFDIVKPTPEAEGRFLQRRNITYGKFLKAPSALPELPRPFPWW